MKFVILIGKIITLAAFMLMLANLIFPFGGKVSLIFNLLLACTILIHGIQVAIFKSTFSQQMTLNGKDYLNVFIFGVFSLMEYKNKLQTSIN